MSRPSYPYGRDYSSKGNSFRRSPDNGRNYPGARRYYNSRHQSGNPPPLLKEYAGTSTRRSPPPVRRNHEECPSPPTKEILVTIKCPAPAMVCVREWIPEDNDSGEVPTKVFVTTREAPREKWEPRPLKKWQTFPPSKRAVKRVKRKILNDYVPDGEEASEQKEPTPPSNSEKSQDKPGGGEEDKGFSGLKEGPMEAKDTVPTTGIEGAEMIREKSREFRINPFVIRGKNKKLGKLPLAHLFFSWDDETPKPEGPESPLEKTGPKIPEPSSFPHGCNEFLLEETCSTCVSDGEPEILDVLDYEQDDEFGDEISKDSGNFSIPKGEELDKKAIAAELCRVLAELPKNFDTDGIKQRILNVNQMLGLGAHQSNKFGTEPNSKQGLAVDWGKGTNDPEQEQLTLSEKPLLKLGHDIVGRLQFTPISEVTSDDKNRDCSRIIPSQLRNVRNFILDVLLMLEDCGDDPEGILEKVFGKLGLFCDTTSFLLEEVNSSHPVQSLFMCRIIIRDLVFGPYFIHGKTATIQTKTAGSCLTELKTLILRFLKTLNGTSTP